MLRSGREAEPSGERRQRAMGGILAERPDVRHTHPGGCRPGSRPGAAALRRPWLRGGWGAAASRRPAVDQRIDRRRKSESLPEDRPPPCAPDFAPRPGALNQGVAISGTEMTRALTDRRAALENQTQRNRRQTHCKSIYPTENRITQRVLCQIHCEINLPNGEINLPNGSGSRSLGSPPDLEFCGRSSGFRGRSTRFSGRFTDPRQIH